jgi:alpha-tubulin suppressor-like RCC1 family protein
VLGEDNTLYYSGYKNSLSNTHYTMQKYDKQLPDGNIVDFSMGVYNIVVLTDEGKMWIEGYDSGYHIDNNYEKYEFMYKPRPNEEEENVIK